VEWQRGGELRLGEVDEGEMVGWRKMTPTVRFGQPDEAVLGPLRAYFARNAWALDPAHRATVGGALGVPPVPPIAGGAVRSAGRDSRRFTWSDAWWAAIWPGRHGRHPRLGVSGKNGGSGNGTAATDK
jgi:hypothetical protein